MFVIRVTSYAFMANSNLQLFFKSVFFFLKACLDSYMDNVPLEMLPSVYFYLLPPSFGAHLVQHRVKSASCMHSLLAQSVFLPKSFGKAQGQLMAQSPLALQACPDFPQLWPSHRTCGKGQSPPRYCYEDRETFCRWGFLLSTGIWPCRNGG